MHLSVRLPKVQPDQIQPPLRCPLRRRNRKPCSGLRFKLHQVVCRKPLRDTRYPEVLCHRYRCLKCGRAFRVYPLGVSNDHQSDTLKALSVLLYILGLSYQGVADLLESLEHPLSKATVYNNVQAAGRQAQRLRREWLHRQAGQVQVLGLDFTHVQCNRQDTIVAVATALLSGQPLTFDLLAAEASVRIEQWIRGLAHTLGADVLVTDDADSLKTVADHLGLKHQICRAHVNRNVHDLVAALGTRALQHPDPVPWELASLTVDQFLEDLATLEWIIQGMPAEGQAQIAALAARYQGAPPPAQGHKATMWYRLRLLTLDWSENWARLALYQHWRSDRGEKLDGTNNVTEQVIGQCVKERYRTMRTYKREASILNVSSLIGWARTNGAGGNLAELVTK
ncbi:MAG: transposase [Actinobacteria bacterium]|nr:transposase [Actinomycetota bacterium]